MTNAKQAIQSMIDGASSYIKVIMNDAVKLSVHANKVDQALEQLENKHQIKCMVSGGTLLVRVNVTKMDQVIPVIEALEQALEIEFDETQDEPAYGWRLFTSKNARWIRIDAEVQPGSQECRKVVVGYETQQVPVYEIKCGEEAMQPDAEIA